MRNRCFIVAAIALVGGFICITLAQRRSPAGAALAHAIETNNSRKWDEFEARKHMIGAETLPELKERLEDPYAADPMLSGISYAAFGLAGVMFLAGFIVGPPKKEARGQVLDQFGFPQCSPADEVILPEEEIILPDED